ncbi:MAG TPA: hypothetical protein DCS48_13750 [Desulfovibrio sp.]|nr:hypothetical protein [Desulfovibrio sp.]
MSDYSQTERGPRIPQTGTGANLFDEFKRDGIEYYSEDAVHIIPFGVPGASAPFSIFASKGDADGRIAERQIAFENFVQNQRYEYDVEGRLNKVWSGERLIEEYLYGEYGERYFAATMRKPQRTFRYDPGLCLEQGGKVKYSYDQQGRLVMKQDGTDVTTYVYHYSG